MRDYYAVLGVGAGATAVQIRRVYQRLARRYSPDVNLWEREARALFEEIAEAYRILSDPTSRTVYDRQGSRPSGRVRPEGRPEGRRGDDLHVPVQLSLSPGGGRARRAGGGAAGATPPVCSHCGGLGTIWREGSRGGVACPACDGAGARVSEPC